MRNFSPHTLILAALLSLGACAPSSSDAPTPKAEKVNQIKAAESSENERLDAWFETKFKDCLLYTSPSPRDQRGSRMPSSA